MHSVEKDLGTILAFILLISSLSQATSYNPDISVSSPLITGGLENIELIYDPSPPPAIFPIERWGKYKISIINRGSKPAALRYDVFSIYDGNEVGISPFPQPNGIYLKPGENQTIWYFLDVSYRTGISPEEMEGEHHIRVKVVIEDAENPEIKKEFYINHTIKIIPPDKLKPNALIEGYVIDADTGEPLANVEVVFVGANGIPSYRTNTDERGHYSIEFYAHKYSDTGLYHGYCLSVGEAYRRAFFPKPGDKISHNVTLKVTESTVEAEYRIVAKYPTGYPIWLADLDKKEKYIVLASGHHTIPIEERDPEKHGLYFFDTNGTLLWRYPTKAQIWGLDISDDGKYVAAALMDPYGKVLLFDNKGNILWDTDELGYDEKFQQWGYGGLESREVKISHNSEYVAVGSTPGLLMLLRLSSGEVLWERFLNGQIRGIVFTEDDKIMYVSSGDGYVYKMSVEKGEVLGRAYVEAWTPRYSLTLSEDERYLVTTSKIGRICLVDAVEMKTIWSFDARGGGHWTMITSDNRLILAGSGGSYGLIAFNYGGDVLWFMPYISSARAFIANKTLFLMANRVFDFNGRFLYEFKELPTEIEFTHVTKDESKIIVVDWKGTLYILEGKLKIGRGVLEEKPQKIPSPLINLDDVPRIERVYEEALKGRFGGGGLESVDFGAMAELGVTWKRIGVDVTDLDFKMLDNHVMACQKAGMILHVILDLPVREMSPDEFAKRVGEIVERYDGDGVKDMPGLKFPIRHYEIMNEIQGRPGWNLKIYKEYYIKAYDAIKRACSECKVSPSSFVGPNRDYLVFLKENGLKFDFLSYHSYVDYLEIDELMRILRELEFGNVEVWITESQFGGMEERLDRSECEVAEAMVKSYVYALARGSAKVSPSELEAKDRFPEGLKHSCLIDVDGRRKPAFHAYKTLIEMIDGFIEADIISKNPFVAEFRFKDKIVYVAWGRGRLPLEGTAQLKDIYGKDLGRADLSKYELKDELVYIKLVKPTLKVSPKISISISKTKAYVGEKIMVSGSITPFKGPAKLLLIINSPKGTFTKRIDLNKSQYNYTIEVDAEGEWSIQVRVEENKLYYSSSSNTLTFTAQKKEATTTREAFPIQYIIIGIIVAAALTIGAIEIKKKRE